ncbi:unnamed protein product [Brachionus calyciflorus]|uniref:Glycine cleavage system H protein, mitochondrial n=1 Tax=Brachionus calyciflorus TaxID=104777 RepID=A0A814C3M5_9BILA|nr:unnamed protein product [Brachionus calyciflorus]
MANIVQGHIQNQNQMPNLIQGQIQNQIQDQIQGQIQNQIQDQIKNLFQNQIQNQIQDLIQDQIQNLFQNQIQNLFQNQMPNLIQNLIRNQNQYQMQNQMSFQMPNNIHNQMPSNIHNQMPNNIHNQMPNNIHNQMPNNFHNQMPNNIHNQMPSNIHNQMPSNIHNQMPSNIQNQMPNNMANHLPNQMPNQIQLAHLIETNNYEEQQILNIRNCKMSLIFKSSRVFSVLGKRLVSNNHVIKKQFSVSAYLAQLKFTTQHEWVKVNGNIGTIGITDYAQDKLGEVVYLELPEVGANLEKSNQFATLESVKAVSECYLPVGGKVTEVNEALKDSPATINKSPFDDGWLAKIEIANPDELNTLMDKSQYDEFLKSDH